MKTIRIAVGLLAAAALLAPAAAHAAPAYTALEGWDDGGDVATREGDVVMKPILDIVSYRATRTASTFKLVVGYGNVKKAKYTRYQVELSGNRPADSSRFRTIGIEMRTEADGVRRVAVYRTDGELEGPRSTRLISCPGASATPDTEKDKIRFVVPAACVTLGRDDAEFYTAASSWTAARWQQGPITTVTKQPDLSDAAIDGWTWTAGS